MKGMFSYYYYFLLINYNLFIFRNKIFIHHQQNDFLNLLLKGREFFLLISNVPEKHGKYL